MNSQASLAANENAEYQVAIGKEQLLSCVPYTYSFCASLA